MKKDQNESTGSAQGLSKWRPLIVVVGLILLVVMLPSIAAQTPLLSWGVSQAASGVNANVNVGSASLGWFSPIVLRNVTVTDLEGEPVAEIPSVRVSKSLLGLISNPSDLGTIEINQPTLHVVVGEGTSNLENLIVPETHDETDHDHGTSTPKMYRLVIREGTVQLADSNSSRTWTVEDFSADVDCRDPNIPAPCSLSANIRDQQQMGVVQGRGTLPGTTGDSNLSIVTKGLPIGVVELLGARMAYPVVARGELNGQVDLVSTEAGPTLQCNLEASGVNVRSIRSTRGNGWANGTLRLTGQIAWVGSHLQANQFTLTTDWGQLLANGNIPVQLGASPNASPAQLLGDQPWQVRGTLDVARLAMAFPDLLQIREGVQIQEGRISVGLENIQGTATPEVRGAANVSNIVASVNGRRVDWNQPLEIALMLSAPGNEIQLDSIACRSSFLTAEGRTNGPQTDVQFTVDGNRLAADLSQLVDLSGNQFAGTLQGSLQVQNLGGGRIALSTLANGVDLKWGRNSQVLLSEPNLQTQCQATIVFEQGQLRQVESAIASLKTSTTTLSAQTATPVVIGEPTVWPIKLQLQGPVDSIWTQIRSSIGFGDFQLGGNGLILAKLTISDQLWNLEGVNVDINNFAIVGPMTQVYENQLKIEGAGSIDWAKGHFASPQFTVVGTTISARGTDVAVPLGSGGTASGKLAYRVDLSRGIHWILPAQWLGQNRVGGELSGSMTLSNEEQGFVLQNNGQIANWELVVPGQVAPNTGPVTQPAAASRQQMTWREPNLTFAQAISLNRQEDSLALHSCTMQSSALKLAIEGGVGQLSSVGNLSMQVQAEYDWAKLAPLVSAIMGPKVSIDGQQVSKFQVAGPIWNSNPASGTSLTIAPTWQGVGDLSWKQANLYGIPAGASTLNAQLRQGALQLTANSPEISGGKLSLQSQLLLNATPMQWQVAQGRAIDNVAITPQMCQSWLQYVAPVVADATRVEGRFSLDFDGGNFPLADPMQGEGSGILTIHGAEVRSGPLSQGYVMLGRNVEALVKGKPATAIDQGSASLLTLPAQQVRFRVVRGRVYHENLIVQSGEVQVVTSGWVDSNEQMQLMAAIPIRDSWIEKAPWLASMRGTALNVPITGTMRQPKIDSNVIEQLTRGMLNNAAQGAIQNGINRGLQELFGPK
ncbi:hypothetical protein [Bremerella cremea]|uniref:hypothetical protein n=1 Tax=Bremerella cremea TaxID=1031537 RepID=UPI0031EC838C